MDTTLQLTVNGKQQTLATNPSRPLLELLREELGLTGAKYGCGEGECGACTVLIDGKRSFSCITPASKCDGKSVQTIEGLSQGDRLHPVQQAFLDEHAYQCGYCIPGHILNIVALLNETPKPTEEQIVKWANRNLCRCNSYSNILRAVRRAAGLSVEDHNVNVEQGR
jgi:aerobic-type carbon monoxide dehydrogenase small subunit (CoxS/CutS family)